MKYQTMVMIPMKARESAPLKVTDPRTVMRLMKLEAMHPQECMHVLTLDVKHNLIRKHMVHMGDYDSCTCSPRVIFERALLDQASAIIIVHNHPTGDPTPSCEDIRITKKLIEAAKIIGIEIIDHVIIGRGVTTFTSMRESGMVNFRQIGDEK